MCRKRQNLKKRECLLRMGAEAMETIGFTAICPFEIGDSVNVQGEGRKIITDIVCNHFVKSGKIFFRYEFDNSGQYVAVEILEKGNKNQ